MNVAELDVKEFPRFTIERIMEQGDEEAVKWMSQHFSRDQIADVLTKSRRLSPKSANFWAMILGIEKGKVRCLSRHCRETRKLFWPY